jgi:hypothetical protein
MPDEKDFSESRGTSKHGSGIIPDADYLFSRARTLFRAAREALGSGERTRLEDEAFNFEQRARHLERNDRYGTAHTNKKE